MVAKTTGNAPVNYLAELTEKYSLLEKENVDLAQRESLLRATLENISDTVVITDDNGKFTFVCPNTNLIFGLSTEEVFLLGSVDKLVHGPICNIDRLRAEKEINNIELSFKDSFGTRRFLLINAKIVNINGGTVLYVMRDISDIKLAEEEKQSAELRFQNFIANFPGVAYQFRLNRQGDYSYDYISDACELFFGVPAAEIVRDASLIIRLIPETDLAEVKRAIKDSADAMTPYQIEHRVVRPDGKSYWIKASSTPRKMANGDVVWDGIGLDITDRKQAEEARTMSEKNLTAAAKAANFGVYSYDFGTGKAYYSPEFLSLFRLPPGIHPTLDDDLVARALHPDDRSGFLEHMKAANNPCGPGILDHEYRIVHPDGQVRWLRVIGKTVFSGRRPTDCPLHANGIIQDITALKTVHHELEAAKARYRTVVEDQTELISRFTVDGKYIFVNQAYCRFFNKNQDELLGGCWQPIAFEEDRERIEQQLLQLSPTHPVVVIENRVHKGDDCIRWVQFVNRGIFNSDNILIEIQSVGRDISDLKEIQMSLQQKEDELSSQNSRLERLNIALEVVIEQKNEQLESLQADIIKQYNSFVKPHIDELKNISQNRQEAQYLNLINQGMQQILSPFAKLITLPNYHLSPMEIRVTSLITTGMTIKSIALELKISPHTVKYHRKNIRSKLGIRNQRINLRSYLLGNLGQEKG
jgi:PAS domain S-box-containing protein